MFVCLQRSKIKGRHEKKYFKFISLNEAEKYAGMSEFSLYAKGIRLQQPPKT